MQFCRDMASPNEPARWISFLGKSGTGKTHLARCIKTFFNKHLYGIDDERFPQERRIRRGGFKAWGDVVGDMVAGDYSGIRDLREDYFVCLDDIGSEYQRNKELSCAKLYEVLNARLGNWTVITANLMLNEIGEKLDVRISSRLIRNQASLLEINTTDFNDR